MFNNREKRVYIFTFPKSVYPLTRENFSRMTMYTLYVLLRFSMPCSRFKIEFNVFIFRSQGYSKNSARL